MNIAPRWIQLEFFHHQAPDNIFQQFLPTLSTTILPCLIMFKFTPMTPTHLPNNEASKQTKSETCRVFGRDYPLRTLQECFLGFYRILFCYSALVAMNPLNLETRFNMLFGSAWFSRSPDSHPVGKYRNGMGWLYDCDIF